MSGLELRGVSKLFGPVAAVQELDLSVEPGELLVVLGPNGAGKTTLLKLIAGLASTDRGRILIAGRDVTDIPAEQRGISLQFQTLALFPDRTAYENLAFPLRRIGMAEGAIDRRVREIAERLRITHVLSRLPATFSGGEAQRVAIGRAIIGDSPVVLLDEPLSNLDLRLRRELRAEIRSLHRDLRRTIVYVTHDRGEALSLGDRIAVLSQGRLLQVAAPDEISARPLHRIVAEILSVPRVNLIPASLKEVSGEKLLETTGFASELPGHDATGLPSSLVLAVTPKGIAVSPQTGPRAIPAIVERVEFQGTHLTVHARIGHLELRALAGTDLPASPGSRVFLTIDPAQTHIVDPTTERVIGQSRGIHVHPV